MTALTTLNRGVLAGASPIPGVIGLGAPSPLPPMQTWSGPPPTGKAGHLLLEDRGRNYVLRSPRRQRLLSSTASQATLALALCSRPTLVPRCSLGEAVSSLVGRGDHTPPKRIKTSHPTTHLSEEGGGN